MVETTVAATSTAPPAAPPPAAAPPAASPAHQGAASRPGVISDVAFDRLDPTEQGKYARVRAGPDGGSVWQDRETLPTETVDDPTKATSGDGKAVVTEDGKLRIGSMELDEADITGLMERHALEQGRKAAMPATAAEYSLDLPSDFVMPEGQTFKFSTDHPVLGPLIGQAKEFALAHGLDQGAFSKMMSLYAASQVHEAQLIAKAQAAEREKLGPMIATRVDAVTQFIRGTVGDDKISKGMTQRILTADDLVGWEKIIRKATSQGAASFRQDGREPGGHQGGRVSEEAYAAMSPSEKWDYARGFDQRQFSGR
jgi:hypothetical protein